MFTRSSFVKKRCLKKAIATLLNRLILIEFIVKAGEMEKPRSLKYCKRKDQTVHASLGIDI